MGRTSNSCLARRLRAIRRDHFGEHGGPLLAELLGIPFRTWAGFEAGRAIPAGVILRLSELTDVDTRWLLTGGGERSLRRWEMGDDRGRGVFGER